MHDIILYLYTIIIKQASYHLLIMKIPSLQIFVLYLLLYEQLTLVPQFIKNGEKNIIN